MYKSKKSIYYINGGLYKLKLDIDGTCCVVSLLVCPVGGAGDLSVRVVVGIAGRNHSGVCVFTFVIAACNHK